MAPPPEATEVERDDEQAQEDGDGREYERNITN